MHSGTLGQPAAGGMAFNVPGRAGRKVQKAAAQHHDAQARVRSIQFHAMPSYDTMHLGLTSVPRSSRRSQPRQPARRTGRQGRAHEQQTHARSGAAQRSGEEEAERRAAAAAGVQAWRPLLMLVWYPVRQSNDVSWDGPACARPPARPAGRAVPGTWRGERHTGLCVIGQGL